MPERDLHSIIKTRVALDQSIIIGTGITNGNIIDTFGFESIEFIVQSGMVFNGTFTFQIEEDDDAGLADAVLVSIDETLGLFKVFCDGDNNITSRMGSIGKKRYQRISISFNGATPSLFSAIAVLGNSHIGLVTQ